MCNPVISKSVGRKMDMNWGGHWCSVRTGLKICSANYRFYHRVVEAFGIDWILLIQTHSNTHPVLSLWQKSCIMPEPILHFQADEAYLKIFACERVVQVQINITDIFFLDFKAPHFWSRFITSKNVLRPFMQLITQSTAVTTTAKDEDKTASVSQKTFKSKVKNGFSTPLYIIIVIILRHFG